MVSEEPPELPFGRHACSRVRVALFDLGVVGRVEDDPLKLCVVLHLESIWPFAIEQGRRGLIAQSATHLDYRWLNSEKEALAAVRAALERVQSDLLMLVLPPLLAQANELGIRNRLLAPFAQEVIDRVYEYSRGRRGEPNFGAVAAARPFTDADGVDRSVQRLSR